MAAATNIIDILVLWWMTSSVMLLLLFVRYGMSSWYQATFNEFYNKMSFFVGLIVHHIGNLILLIWFWFHRGQVSNDNIENPWVLVSGLAIATYGVFYKIRTFSYSTTEMLATAILAAGFSILYVFAH